MDGGGGRTPRYAEILDALRADIASGVFPVGASLPSEAVLCRRFDVSRFTVREALRRLQADGMVERVQGAGSKVVRDAPAEVFVQNYRSVSDLTMYAETTHLEMLSITEVKLDAETAPRIGGGVGETWCFFRALRRTKADAPEPIAFIESYIPARFAPLAPGFGQTSGPIYAALSSASGDRIVSATQETQALPAPYHVAAALGVDEGSPLLRILRVYSGAAGTLIASFNWHHGGDRYIHRATLSLDGA